MSKENGVEALDRYIRRLSAHPHDVRNTQQVAIKITEQDEKEKTGLCGGMFRRKKKNGSDNVKLKRIHLN